jgi:hypothetical protein
MMIGQGVVEAGPQGEGGGDGSERAKARSDERFDLCAAAPCREMISLIDAMRLAERRGEQSGVFLVGHGRQATQHVSTERR